MYQSKTIVIVDDDAIVTSTLRTLLNMEGFTNAKYFNDPDEALEFLRSNKPDLIMSDFMMPQMNGIVFLEKSKRLYPEVSTILLTGYADKENAIKAINEVGLYKYVEKPWDNDELVVSIKNGIERSSILSTLSEKVKELEVAKIELQQYNTQLEFLVDEKTKELAKSNEQLSAVIDYCGDGIMTIDGDGKILSANPACEYMFGLSERLLGQKEFKDLINIEDGVFEYGMLLDSKSSLLKDFSIKNFVKDWYSPAQISFSSILDEANLEETQKYVCVIRDMSSQKEAQRLRDDFIATLTHDLRTPLLASIQTLEYFLDGTLGELEGKQALLLDTMKRSNEDMLGLVNALLEVYKYEAGKLDLCKTNFKINELVKDCCEQMLPLADKLNLELILELEQSEGLEISADKKELKRVLINLVSNAIHHTQVGRVTVKTSVKDNDFTLQVIDTGIGISKDDMKHLFKRFSQGTSQKRSCSTGLGLYLSRQIIEAHQGKIWSESFMGKGSVFSFLLSDVIVNRTSDIEKLVTTN